VTIGWDLLGILPKKVTSASLVYRCGASGIGGGFGVFIGVGMGVIDESIAAAGRTMSSYPT